jgi:pyridoxal phosphate enzyme (YggS family)
MNTDISRNLQSVSRRIEDAAARAGRPAGSVRLIAVSKTMPLAAVGEAIAAGQREFGENTAQDALTKILHIARPDVQWHFIGHLQSKKAKQVPGHFQWVHSLDSLRLAEKLSSAMQSARASNPGLADLNVLVQVNVAGDPAKHGLPAEDVEAFLEKMQSAAYPGIALRGFMTIGYADVDVSRCRRHYARLRALRDRCAQQFGLKGFTELSMGMSGDYAAAIAEGATMVRLGTAIFGRREYAKS